MKKSVGETAETRRRIVKLAAREFAKSGVQGTGIGAVMAAAGLTQGGFYRHFDSKDQLVTEAVAAGIDMMIAQAKSAVSNRKGSKRLEALVAAYLSLDRRPDSLELCPLAGLGSELARTGDDTRQIATSGFLRLVDLIATCLPNEATPESQSKATFIVCAMIGAVTMSRIVPEPSLAMSILREARRQLTTAKLS